MRERDRYQMTASNKKAISAVPHFNVSDKFVLSKEDASYMLSLEVQMPIDNILLQVSHTTHRIPYIICNKIKCQTCTAAPPIWLVLSEPHSYVFLLKKMFFMNSSFLGGGGGSTKILIYSLNQCL